MTKPIHPYTVVDDEANKAVVVNGRVTFGYTGLSAIGGVRTDDWLVRVIAGGPDNDMAEVATRIKDRACSDFRRLNIPAKFKRHAFQGVGWFRPKRKSQLSPGILTIDNAIDHRTGRWLDEALSEFQVTIDIPLKLPGRCILDSVGFIPLEEEKGAVVRLVRQCVKHRGATYRTVVQSLVISLRWLSSRHLQIGPGLMVVCIPRRSVEESERTGQRQLTTGPPNEFAPTFLYVSATDSKVYFGPHFVAGGTSITGLEISS